MVSVVDFQVISILIVFVIIAKLPLFGLHIWLPKVHVEASMLGSVFLAALILKAGSVIYYLIAGVLPIITLILVSVYVILTYVDGKGIVAMSSVIHISICVLALVVVWISRYVHILTSSMMFMMVYAGYKNSGSRLR